VLVLGISGSPREGGNTDTLLGAFLDEAEKAGAQIEKIVPARMTIKPCIECRTCEDEGFCPIDDDMQGVYRLLREADIVAAASPIFFYGVTAWIKAIIDRTQCLWARRHVLGLIDPGAASRVGVFLSVGATKGERLFDGASLTMKYFFDAVGARFAESLLYRRVEHPGDIALHPTALGDARESARRISGPFAARKKVLFLCRENAARSQMARAFARYRAGDRIEAASAGDHPAAAVNPDMVSVMAQLGIDMAFITPRSISEALVAGDPSLVVTMGCMDACPVIPGAEIVDWGLADPAGKGIEHMRETRDEILRRVDGLIGA
jgi:arsenate reductase